MQQLRILSQHAITRLTGYKPVQFVMRIAVRLLIPRRRIGAALILFNQQGEILLLHHVFHGKHPWALPGGWTNRTEMPDQTVIRELKEETNLTATIGKALLFTPSAPNTSVNIYFYASNPQGDIKLSYEANKAGWFAPDALPSHMLKRNYEAIQLAVAERQKNEG